MQRKNTQPLIRWNQNRAGSLLLLGISLILISISVLFVYEMVTYSNESTDAEIELAEKELELEGVRVDISLATDSVYQSIIEFDKQNQNQNVITFK